VHLLFSRCSENTGGLAAARKSERFGLRIDDDRASGTREEGKGRVPARDEKMGPHVAYAEARKELEDGHVVANEKRGEAG